ncbi:site-specific integrase [Microbacterium lacus]|uniref:tyrosine-type recombinase/integrase n=1 Tax=Microbacterium lacus TaxID=415217 RepID=UPI00384C3611
MSGSTLTRAHTAPPDTSGMWHAGGRLDDEMRRKWLDALNSFEVAQRAKKAQPATVARRVRHVRKFASEVALSPWHVTAEDVQGWLERLDVADSTRLSMRDSLRAFYRWAHVSGRMLSDPTECVSYRAVRLPVPTSWEQPLTAYERHLWAKGSASTTVRAHMEQMRSFARENASLDPFAVRIDDLYEWMAGKRWARETRRARKVTLRGFYTWAVETDRIDANPTDKLPKIRSTDPIARPASDDEYEAAMRMADDRGKIALRLSAELGLRRAEVARVHSADLERHAEQGTWLTVHGKGAKIRRVPVPESLALTLRTLPEGYVFPGQIVERQSHAAQTGHISPRYLGKLIAQLLPAGVTMHALRHRFATRAYNVNRDVFTVQRLLGHASAATTQRYVQVSDDGMRALVEAVNP